MMNPPLVKTTRTVPLSARAGETELPASNASNATARNPFTRFFIGCPPRQLIRGRTGLVEFDHDARDVGGDFEAAFGALQGDDDTLVVLELHAADTAG